MKKLFPYLKPYRKECILAPLFKLLEASFELIVPLIIANIIDNGISNGDHPLIWKMCGCMVILAVIGLVCAIFAQYFAAKAAVGFSKQVKSSLFKKIQSLSYSDLDNLGNSTIITRMTSDVNSMQNAVNLFLRLFLRAPVIVFGAMIMAFTINVKAALIFVVVTALLSIVVFGIMHLTVPMYKKVQEKLDKLLGITRENLTGTRVIRAFTMEENEVKRFEKANNEIFENQKFVSRFSSLTNPLTFLLINTAIIILIYTGALQVESGILSKGQVIALYNYMSQILVELVKLANLIVSVTKGMASARRVESLFDMKSSEKEIISNEKLTNGNIKFENVGLTYSKASSPSLTNLSFEIKSGEKLGIVGSTGSGKTSVVNLIPGFYPNTDGKIFIGDKDINSYNAEYLRENIGVVPQYSKLFKGTVRENIRMGNENASDEDIINALKYAQAWDFISEKEDVLDFKIEAGGRNLSGGQKQRLTIARALVRKPKILILDDSSSALDYQTDNKLKKAIENLDYGPTLVIVSQRASSVLSCDKVLVLEDGECVGFDSPSELIKNCDIYKEIYYCQFPKKLQKGDM